jgi:hypothetical protein
LAGFAWIRSDGVLEIVLIVGKCTDPNGRIFRHATSSLIMNIIMVLLEVLDHLLNTVHGKKEAFAPSVAAKEAWRLCTTSRWKGFNKRGFRFFGVGFGDVCVDVMQRNRLGSEKVSVPVFPSFFLTSSLYICYDGTELTKCDSSQFNWHVSDFCRSFWRFLARYLFSDCHAFPYN